MTKDKPRSGTKHMYNKMSRDELTMIATGASLKEVFKEHWRNLKESLRIATGKDRPPKQ